MLKIDEDEVRSSIVSESNSETVASKESNKWFPGKFLGFGRKDSTESSAERNSGDKEEDKQESMIVRTIRAIRLKFLDRQIVGKIYMHRISGIVTTGMTSEITAEDILLHLKNKIEKSGTHAFLEADLLLTAEITGNYKRALSATDTILNSLERRSLSWVGAEFAGTTMLTRGTQIGVSDPFIGLANFQFILELSGTVHSLLASRRRYEAARDLANSSQNNVSSIEGDRITGADPSSLSNKARSSFSSWIRGSNANVSEDVKDLADTGEFSDNENESEEIKAK